MDEKNAYARQYDEIYENRPVRNLFWEEVYHLSLLSMCVECSIEAGATSLPAEFFLPR